MADVINIDVGRMNDKISELKDVQSSLESGFQVQSYAFGSASGVQSTGVAADSMGVLNSEYKATTEKLAALVGATVGYLENVLATFEEADSI